VLPRFAIFPSRFRRVTFAAYLTWHSPPDEAYSYDTGYDYSSDYGQYPSQH
jgi:hypothetical protein